MGFSGGGGSASGVSAHVHDNNPGEGGSLNSGTLINDGSLFAQMVAFG